MSASHAIGDRGIDWVVDTYADRPMKATSRSGICDDAIIHANVPTDHAIEVMADAAEELRRRVSRAVRRRSMWWLGDTYAGELRSRERATRLDAVSRPIVKKGVIWGGGSDYSVTPFAARYASLGGRSRGETLLNGTYGKTPFGTRRGRGRPRRARSRTRSGRRITMFSEKRIGSIEPGKCGGLSPCGTATCYTVPTDAAEGC